MLSEELLSILVCPACKTKVTYFRQQWLLCDNPDCRRKYPIKDDIPIMLIEEGDKWRETAPESLPDTDQLRF
jgi:uncharacterized protein YbaR (Trm112 family)